MKKYLILAIVALIAIGLVVGGYFLRKGGAGQETTTQNNTSTQNQLPTGPNGGVQPKTPTGPLGALTRRISEVASKPVKEYFVDSQGKVTFIQTDGEIFVADSKDPRAVNSTAISGLLDASFSFDGKMVAVRFGNPENPQVSVFDINNRVWKPLDFSAQSLAWSPKNYQLLYLTKTDRGVTLGSLDFSQRAPKPRDIFSWQANDLNLKWIQPEKVFLTERASAQTKNSLWSFDLVKKTFTPIIRDRSNLLNIWNASGTLSLEFSGKELKVTDGQGNLVNKIDAVTLPDKCVFSFEMKNASTTAVATGTKKAATPQLFKEEYLNCAIPSDLDRFEGLVLPDDYYKKVIFTEDNIYQINFSSGAITPLFVGDGVDAINLKRADQKIYFINRFDGKLYAVPIASS